jgi:hypothetical protein
MGSKKNGKKGRRKRSVPARAASTATWPRPHDGESRGFQVIRIETEHDIVRLDRFQKASEHNRSIAVIANVALVDRLPAPSGRLRVMSVEAYAKCIEQDDARARKCQALV